MKSIVEIVIAVASQLLWFTIALWLITTAHDNVPSHLQYRLEALVSFSGFIMYVAGVLLLARFSYVRLMKTLHPKE